MIITNTNNTEGNKKIHFKFLSIHNPMIISPSYSSGSKKKRYHPLITNLSKSNRFLIKNWGKDHQ